MEGVFLCVSLVSFFAALEAAPWGTHDTNPQQQACGDKLADIMSLACSGRGYNIPFRPERNSSRRFRRQIVDECCYKSCNFALLQLYCNADPTEATNSQIRKRSDSEAMSTEIGQYDMVKLVTEQLKTSTESAPPPPTPVSAYTSKDRATSATKKKPTNDNYKLLNLLSSSEHNFKQKSKQGLNSEQNDTLEEESFKQNSVPPIRHHKNLHHSRQLRNRKTNGKTKRERSTSDEKTFQIGTVKPYFASRGFIVSYRGNYVHQNHTPTSE